MAAKDEKNDTPGGAHAAADEDHSDEQPFPDSPPYNTPEEGFEAKYAASCHCGAVHYQVNSEPVSSVCCHCTTCQVVHGATSQRAILFKKDMVKFDSASLEHLAFYQTHDKKIGRHLPCKVRCKTCGTLIADEGKNMFLAFPGLFDVVKDQKEPDTFKIQHHMFYDQRQKGMAIQPAQAEGVKFWAGAKEKSEERTA